MALFFADLVREASWDAGAGDLALGGALPGHRRFADVVPAGARFHYCIAGVTEPDEWETGEGAIGDDGKLVRSPLTSSADNQRIDFSPGLKTVSLTVAAAWYADMEDGGGVDPELIAEAIGGKADLSGAAFSGPLSASSLSLGADLAVSEGGTGASTPAGARANLGIVPGIDVEPHSPALTALAALDGQPGLVEQIGADDFAKRDIGVGSGSALPTLADADARYQPLDADLSAIAASVTTSFGRSLLTVTDAASLRGTAGLGTVATRDIGTSGASVPLLDGANIFSGATMFSNDVLVGNGAAFIRLRDTDTSGANLTSYVRMEDSGGILRGYVGFRLGDGDFDLMSTVGAMRFGASNSIVATITNSGLAVTGSVSISMGAAVAGDVNVGTSGQFLLRAATHAQVFSTGNFEFRDYASGGIRLSISNAGVISDKDGVEIGYRDIPRVTGGLERGKCFATGSGVTLDAGAAAGATYSIYNDSGSPITLAQGAGLTLRLAGSAGTGNRTLAARGFATIWYNGTTEAVVSGSGVS